MGSGNSKPAAAPGPSAADLQREKDARQREEAARAKVEKSLAEEKQKTIENNQKIAEMQETLQALQQQMEQEQTDRSQLASQSSSLAEELRLARENLQSETSARAEQLALQQAELLRLQQEAIRAQKTIEERENDLRCYPVPVYMMKLQDCLNIAVTGASGVGKSSLLNALRRIKSSEPGFARVGDVETTLQPTPYTFPNRIGFHARLQSFSDHCKSACGVNLPEADGAFDVGDKVILQNIEQDNRLNGEEVEIMRCTGGKLLVKLENGTVLKVGQDNVTGKLQNCVLWDLPGTGTPKFPQKTYIQLMGIRHFDLVLLLTAERFTEAEALLMKELEYWNVPFLAVRTKIDQAIEAALALKEEEIGEDEELSKQAKEEVSCSKVKEIKMALKETHNLRNIYAISTLPKLRRKFDFVKLEKDMQTAVKHQRGISLEEECPICFDEYSDYGGGAGERLAAHPCGHTACAMCWQQTPSLCPICRSAVTLPPAAASSSSSASAGDAGYMRQRPSVA